jgi:coenzyme F420 hydrogenase subunit beta
LEKFVFRRQRKPEEEFGIYQSVLVARSTDRNVLKVCQDGGVVTTLLTFAMKNKIIDGAAVSGIDKHKPLYPVPILATTPEQILQCAGTRYFYSPNLLALRRGIEQDRKHIAFVGSPCQIEAVRRIQTIPSKNYVERLKLTVGLMCSESFSYTGLVENYIKTKLGINPNDISKINIKSKFVLEMKSGETKEIPLKTVQQYARTNCTTCKDFSAELADISVGGIGLNGWSLVVIRTETAKKLFADAVKTRWLEVESIKEKKRSLELLINLSKNKRTGSKK